MGGNQAETGCRQDATPPDSKLNTRKNRNRSQRGQSMVELALVLPLFFLIVMATIDFGWAFRTYITATNAAREGARLGVTGASQEAIETRVRNTGDNVFDNYSHDIVVTGAQGERGSDVSVQVEVEYEYITPIGGLIHLVSLKTIDPTITLSSETVMRLE